MKTWKNEHELIEMLQQDMPHPQLDAGMKNQIYQDLIHEEQKLYKRRRQVQWMRRSAFACAILLLISFFTFTNPGQQLLENMASSFEPHPKEESLLGTTDRHGEPINDGYLQKKATVEELHHFVHGLIGEDERNLESIDWNKLEVGSDDVIKKVEEIIMIPTLEPMDRDLVNLMDCFLLSIEQNDAQALRYAHQILHDLDYHWFHDYSKEEKPYGLAHIVTGSMKVDHYIRQQNFIPYMQRQIEKGIEIQSQ